MGPFYLASNSVIRDQREAPQRLRMSPTHVGCDGAGASEEVLLEEVKDSGPVGGDEKVKIDLDDEPGSLLNSLNAWREKVVIGEVPGILGLSRPVELILLNLLTSQLDHELFSHNVIVAGLQKKGGWSPPERAQAT